MALVNDISCVNLVLPFHDYSNHLASLKVETYSLPSYSIYANKVWFEMIYAKEDDI